MSPLDIIIYGAAIGVGVFFVILGIIMAYGVASRVLEALGWYP